MYLTLTLLVLRFIWLIPNPNPSNIMFYVTHYGDIQLLAAVTLTLIIFTNWLYIILPFTLDYKCLNIYDPQMISKIAIILKSWNI